MRVTELMVYKYKAEGVDRETVSIERIRRLGIQVDT